MGTYAALEPTGGEPAELFWLRYEDTSWFWTSGNVAVVKDGDTYEPIPISAGPISANEEAHTNNIELSVELDNPVVELFKPTQPSSPISITVYGWQRDASDFVVRFEGRIKNCTVTSDSATLVCGPTQDVVQRKIAALVYQANCNNRLYDFRCRVNKADWTWTFDVAAITSGPAGVTIELEAAAGTEFTGASLDWLAGGVAVFASPIGLQRQMIVGHSGTDITLLDNFVGLVVTDELTLYAGCDKSQATCIAKFNNLPRFQGFPHVPIKNPFGGGSLK